MPIETIDPFSGIIVMGYWNPLGGDVSRNGHMLANQRT